MQPVDFRARRMLQRNVAPIPLNLAPASLDEIDPASNNENNANHFDDLHHVPSKSMNRPVFAQNFNFGIGSAAPSPPPSAGLPQPRPRSKRGKSPSSARTSMIEDEDSEWDTTKMLPQFQHTLRRPSLLTPPTTGDSRRQSYDRTTHLGYDDGSTETLPPGRRSSVPTHHLRPEQSPDRHPNATFRRSSLATTSVTRKDMEHKSDVDVLSEVDSAEEELVEDNADLESVQEKTKQLNIDDGSPSPTSRKRESPEEDANVYAPVNTPIPNPFATMHDVPRPYVMKRLMDLGPFFVGHEATAQAFVQAIPLNEKESLYKVEVVPQDAQAKPYRLVKRHKSNESEDESDGTPPPDSPIEIPDSDDEENYESPSLPIHVEYAVYRLPLLGSMLLSGQVFCGDTLRMPLPYPEVWTAVVGWMYTNKVVRLPGVNVHDQAEMVRECIEFLGGRV